VGGEVLCMSGLCRTIVMNFKTVRIWKCIVRVRRQREEPLKLKVKLPLCFSFN
jgi:hypothetical protein